ncbi:DUF3797 domain-containing protein [Patescibacteria group bacterium]|nr:DUF3797 domain-containing protein [Patescibacteria group bacterium]MBU1123867.1 DUF3797 domain-containing protein [Patescibacteria group bacterium]MBU1910954.1 DUF3797 domain-containing protein [Patescibacteria group bacterium]
MEINRDSGRVPSSGNNGGAIVADETTYRRTCGCI